MLYTLPTQEPAPPTPAMQPTAGKVCASDFADRSDMVATMLLAPSGLGQIQTGLEKHFYSKGNLESKFKTCHKNTRNS